MLVLAGWCAGLVCGQALLPPDLGGVFLVVGTGLATLALAVRTLGPRGLWLILAVAAAVSAGAGRGASSAHVVGPGTLDYYLGRHVTLTGTVARSSGTSNYQSFWLAEVTMAGAPRGLAGSVQVTARSTNPVAPGSTARVTGTLERLPGRAYDGSTGYDDRMERAGVLAAMPAANVVPLAPTSPWSLSAMAWRVRGSLAAEVRTQVPEPEATILLGELVGIRGKLPTTVEADLVDSGLIHLLAVSGLKVALVAGVLAGLLRHASRRAALLAIIGIFVYAVVGGGSSAAVRSALMGSLGLLAQVLRRDVDPPRSLLMAAAVLLGLHPALASDLSFQYSFLGVAGIQFLERPLSRYLRLVPRPFREALSVSLAAQLATLPLTAAYFHVLSLSGPLVNTLVVPFLPAAMASAGWIGAGLPSLSGVAPALAAGGAHVVLALAAAAASAPGGAIRVPWFGAADAAGYYLAAALLLLARERRLPAVGAGAVAVIAALAVVAWAARPDGRLHVAVLDTPGGGVLVTAPDGSRMLVDTGSSPGSLAGALDAQLAPLTPGLDAVLVTGSGPGAAGGIGGLGARVPGLFLFPSETPGDVPLLVGEALAAHGARTQQLAPGDRLDWHGLNLAVDSCGAGLALTLRLQDRVLWLCGEGVGADRGVLPVGPIDLVDVGDGRVGPEGDLGSARWVTEHTAAGGRGGLAAAPLGGRLWRSAQDGPLLLVCDLTSCHR